MVKVRYTILSLSGDHKHPQYLSSTLLKIVIFSFSSEILVHFIQGRSKDLHGHVRINFFVSVSKEKHKHLYRLERYIHFHLRIVTSHAEPGVAGRMPLHDSVGFV
jgi:hypothetical protein